MKNFKIAAVSIGFFAGVAFMVSCGGGGTNSASASGTPIATDPPVQIPVSQVATNVGDVVVIGGKSYTIVQFEIPKFDTDEVYLLKYPSSQTFSSGTASEYVTVNGGYSDGDNTYTTDYATTLNGFNVLVGEGLSYTAQFTVNNSGRSLVNRFSQYLSMNALVGPKTSVNIYFSNAVPSVTTTDPTRSANAGGLTTVFGPAKNVTDRNSGREDLRQLLAYVSITKKP